MTLFFFLILSWGIISSCCLYSCDKKIKQITELGCLNLNEKKMIVLNALLLLLQWLYFIVLATNFACIPFDLWLLCTHWWQQETSICRRKCCAKGAGLGRKSEFVRLNAHLVECAPKNLRHKIYFSLGLNRCAKKMRITH